jgi:hypothetical protein
MGKIDNLRKQREAQFAAQHRDAVSDTAAGADEPLPAGAGRTARAAVVPESRCSGCGKVRPLKNGLIAPHQKGLGKVCVGSRKEPA